MNSKYKKLFTPLTVKNMTLRNRIVMPPMGTNYGQQNGEMSSLHMNYYEQRAKGGTGLIIVENACVDFPLGSNGTTQIRLDHDNFIPCFYKLCETVHKHGSCISVQINHAGASAMSSRTNLQPVSASNIPSKQGGELPRPLTKSEIEETSHKYAMAAKRAQMAGFDAVEIHGGHSYLISQFLSPLTNDRNDEFGGSAQNRARFAKMVMEETRRQVGPEFPIILRISADELMEGGNSLEDTLELLEYFQEEADIIDVSAGLNGSIQYQIDANYLPDGWRSFMAKAVREKFNKVVMTTGNIRNPEAAEEILKRGDSDLIGIGRGLIADPDWVKKVKQGNEESIRKCISCNIGCAGHRIGLNRPIRCTVNPSVLEGDVYQNQRINSQRNVVVVGGGTSGLEAACTSAEVGCTTFLIEKEGELGGLAREISRIPDKNRLADFPEYLEKRAKNLQNLFIFRNRMADVEFIRSLNPHLIVNATGSTPLLPPIPGIENNVDVEGSSVFSITGMIRNMNSFPKDLKGKKVVVVGGGAVGLDVVEFFAPRNASISIIEMQNTIGKDLDPVSKVGIETLIRKNNVNSYLNTKLVEVREHSFVVDRDGTEFELEFDYGFVCLGMRSNAPILNDLYEHFEDSDTEIINIGDSLRARRIIDGVQEGRNILNSLADHLI